VHGPAEGATIFILGLLPGMDLSAGGAFGENSWQLGATDVANGWIAPPKNFVGSAELVAELRLPNNKIADRQVLHLEWLPSDPAPALVQQNATEPPNSPAVRTTQAEIAQAPLNPREPAQPQFDKQANTSAGVDRRLSGLSEGLASADVVPKGHISPPKGNSKQAGRTAGRRRLAPQPDLRDGKNESRPAIAPGAGARIGFWDWSR
jgi:hypothetical protein